MNEEKSQRLPNVASVVPGMSVTNLLKDIQLNIRPQQRMKYHLTNGKSQRIISHSTLDMVPLRKRKSLYVSLRTFLLHLKG